VSSKYILFLSFTSSAHFLRLTVLLLCLCGRREELSMVACVVFMLYANRKLLSVSIWNYHVVHLFCTYMISTKSIRFSYFQNTLCYHPILFMSIMNSNLCIKMVTILILSKVIFFSLRFFFCVCRVSMWFFLTMTI
jgi:hypothetical protein